jgi:hypothetical protein
VLCVVKKMECLFAHKLKMLLGGSESTLRGYGLRVPGSEITLAETLDELSIDAACLLSSWMESKTLEEGARQGSRPGYRGRGEGREGGREGGRKEGEEPAGFVDGVHPAPLRAPSLPSDTTPVRPGRYRHRHRHRHKRHSQRQ